MKKSYMLGLIIDDILDPFFNEVIKGAEKYSRDNGYRLILSTADDEPIEKVMEVLLNCSAVEGILIGGTKKLIRNKEIIEKINNKGVPVVLVANSLGEIPSINIDNFKGGYMATDYLVSLGYKKIAIITEPEFEASTREDSRERLNGYKKALSANNIEISNKYIIKGNFSYESGYLAMKQFIELNKPPDAVFACDDQMALGAISAANEAGKKVPEDMSVIGFDNIIQAEYSSPKLTTIGQPRIAMGGRAAKLLIDLTEEKEIKKKRIVFNPELIERNSCKSS